MTHVHCPDAYPSDSEVPSPGRRAFMRRSSQLALAGTALPFALNLAAVGDAAAAEAGDYKALVCVFLYGGNDYANTVVNYDSPSYAAYSNIRGTVALARNDLTSTLLQPTAALPDGRQYALNPAMTAMAGLFHSGVAAVQLNVGSLVAPMTRAQYTSGAVVKPPRLFSHNDQQSIWQASAAEGATVGWGGRLGDFSLASNGSSTFTCISASGNAVFLSGHSALPYQVSTSGAVRINAIKSNVYGSAAVKAVMGDLLQQQSNHLLENEYGRISSRAITAEVTVSNALGSGNSVSTPFPANNSLADQLKVVARLIAARNTLNVKRQVFFVSLNGFDLHNALLSQHPILMEKVSEAMAAFYRATVELGVADQVTAFTASDFGRTLATNGAGADHGWGSHHFVVGGAVKGKAFYGNPPPVSIGDSPSLADDQWHVGQGRLLPSTSVDQYAATMARWFGVPDADLDTIFPNLKNFGAAAGRPDYPRDMGFMRAG
ncbi:DUF1501 domain-containing protein [Xylophilus sp. GOD-11R]|uniref:DUF1501 domain-containing protein n=1 Tax=Xylophilus sp. GOD-11R TaxID=3089814 RepID=UPI00298C96DC|nr:DUF1501 domain-containing protein [Xylophilus sp. GOD-11R]WPB55973.1 DUF1501 domain-containing protein [Xylophilus sp. GOD-11R]